MTMIHEGEVQYETDLTVKRMLEAVVRKHGNTVQQVGRWAILLDQVFVSTKTPKPKKPRVVKQAPPRDGIPANDGPDAEPEQDAEQSAGKPPHLQVLRWVKPPPSVQVHMRGAKLGKGLAQFLEVRTDLWALMTDHDREAAIMTKLLERSIVTNDDGDTKIKKSDLPIQTHPAVQEAYGAWWERMDPSAGPTTAPTGARSRGSRDDGNDEG